MHRIKLFTVPFITVMNLLLKHDLNIIFTDILFSYILFHVNLTRN